MSKEPLISIIMPAYNAEKYIERAVDSICCQSFNDYELIIVDDGSDDGTHALISGLIRRYSDKDISLMRQNNRGCCAARNRGLEIARGKYVGFCDNDDVMWRDALLDHIDYFASMNIDVIKWNYETVSGSGKKSVLDIKDGLYLNDWEWKKDFSNVRKTLGAVWNGLYSLEFLNSHSIRFREDIKYGGEDLRFMLEVLLHSPRLLIDSSVYYSWYKNKGYSTTFKHDESFCDVMVENLKIERECLLESDASDNRCAWEIEYMNSVKYIIKYAAEISYQCMRKYMTILINEF